MQIHLTQMELKHLAAEELSRQMGETLTIDDLRIISAPIEGCIKPDVRVFDLLKDVANFPNHLTTQKIACIKNLREKGALMGVNIPIAQAKFFVESIPQNLRMTDVPIEW